MSAIVGSAVLLVGLATVASTDRISSASPAEAMLRTELAAEPHKAALELRPPSYANQRTFALRAVVCPHLSAGLRLPCVVV